MKIQDTQKNKDMMVSAAEVAKRAMCLKANLNMITLAVCMLNGEQY